MKIFYSIILLFLSIQLVHAKDKVCGDNAININTGCICKPDYHYDLKSRGCIPDLKEKIAKPNCGEGGKFMMGHCICYKGYENKNPKLSLSECVRIPTHNYKDIKNEQINVNHNCGDNAIRINRVCHCKKGYKLENPKLGWSKCIPSNEIYNFVKNPCGKYGELIKGSCKCDEGYIKRYPKKALSECMLDHSNLLIENCPDLEISNDKKRIRCNGINYLRKEGDDDSTTLMKDIMKVFKGSNTNKGSTRPKSEER